MATSPPKPPKPPAPPPHGPQKIFEKDPKNKWAGGTSESVLGTGASTAGMTSIVQKQRVFEAKLNELNKRLRDKNLGAAEKQALNKTLIATQSSLKAIEATAKAEEQFIKKSERYRQDAIRKLAELHAFVKAEAKKKEKPQSATEKQAQANRDRLLKAMDTQLRYLAGTGTEKKTTRWETAEAIDKIEKLTKELPEDLQKIFADEKKERDKFKENLEEDQEEDRKEQRRQRKENSDFLENFKSEFKSRGLSVLDNIGISVANWGNVARATGFAFRGLKSGVTGIQKYAQQRAGARSATQKSDTTKTKLDWFNRKGGEDKDNPFRNTMSLKDTRNGMDDFDEKDELANEDEEIKILKDHAAETARFDSRMLDAVKAKSRHDASNDSFLGKGGKGGDSNVIGSGVAGALGAAASTAIKGVLAGLAEILLPLLPGAIALAVPAIALWLFNKEKKKIEANPTAPEYKDNPYAMKLRKEADSVTQATKMNQQKAIKTLRPGEAREYLKRMDEDKVDNFDGYTRAQVEQFANPTAPKDAKEAAARSAGVDKFVKIKTEAQKKAEAAQFVKDDNGDTQRMAARSQVSIPTAGSAGAAPVGVSGQPLSGTGTGTLPGDAGSGGMIKNGMGKIFSTDSNVDIDGINPQMQSKLSAMAQEYYDKTGKKINITSGYRSLEKQAELFRTLPKGQAAAPGRSLHNYGMAIDIDKPSANELDKLGLLDKYGFERPIKGEKWHVQPKGMSVAAAKSGIYSADAPTAQGQGQGGPATASSTPSSPTVSDAQTERPPTGSGPPVSEGKDSGGQGGQEQSRAVSVASIPTFDSSDGMFLSLNMGVI
jgi:hypothetical protein